MTLPRLAGWLLTAVLIAGGLLMFAPFYWVTVTAFTPQSSAFNLPPSWLPTTVTLANFREVFHQVPFLDFTLNSLEIATIATVGSLVTSTLAGYAFAKLRIPGASVVFALLLASLMIPPQVTAIPTFVVMRHFGLVDKSASVYLPGLISVFGIFLMRQFFRSVPRELTEAAKLDGAGELRILWKIAVPMARPALAVVAILTFQFYWTDFFWPNIFLFSEHHATLPLGLVQLQGAHNTTSAAVVFAAIALVVLPTLVVFLFAQRHFTDSLARAGLKG